MRLPNRVQKERKHAAQIGECFAKRSCFVAMPPAPNGKMPPVLVRSKSKQVPLTPKVNNTAMAES